MIKCIDCDDEPYVQFDAFSGSAWLDCFEFDENETKTFEVCFDWDAKGDGVVKDWSVTAWGESHNELAVAHSDDSLETKNMPQHTDNKEGVTPP